MKKQNKMIISLIVVTILLGTIAFAGGTKATIEVMLNSVNLTVNGQKVEADTIVFNGTTYVPLRATAEMLGKEVGWDQATMTASIDDKAVVKDPEPATSKGNPIEVKESEIGKLAILKKNEAVNMVKESGPFVVKVDKIQIGILEASENYKSMFKNKDKVTFVTLQIEVENKDKKTNTLYPDQGTITTNTKEQKDADLFLSDNVGGEFIGEVIKKGNVIFILDSEAEKITNIKYIISAPFSADWDSIGKDIVFDIAL